MNTNTQASDPVPAPAPIGHNSADRASGKPQAVPLDRVVIWQPAQAELDDMTEIAIADEIEIVATAGQRCSAIGRERTDGKIEVVARAHVVEAARRYAADNPADKHFVDIIVYKLDDKHAFRFLAQDVDTGPAWSSLARGRIFLSAVEQFGTVEAAAKACRVSKATVSKNLDVARCIAVIGARVVVQRDIRQRDAAWLMSLVGRKPDGSDAPSAADREAILAAIEELEIASARKVFASLRRAVAATPPAPHKGVEALMHDDKQIGTVTRKKAGAIRIDLTDAGDVELDALMRLIKKVIASKRQATI